MAMKRESVHPFDFTISPERIAERAYFLYVERGCADGHDLEDWLRAEAELSAESTTPSLTVVADNTANGRRPRTRRTIA